jgi:hypothetical protein
MTTEYLRTLLTHPDAHVRSLADWSLETRGAGWRRGECIAPYRVEDRLRDRLAALAARGLIASAEYYL